MSLERLIDLSEEPARLSVQNGLLVIDGDGRAETTIPLREIAVLMVSNHSVTYTHAVLAEIARAGGAFVACDGKHLPVAILLPVVGHTTQAERFRQQLAASKPTCKRLWQQIVAAKIRAQGKLLSELHGSDRGLIAMSRAVRSGDAGHLEAQASRRYWPVLFEDRTFRRAREAGGRNALLNYGYTILRAVVARAVVAAGLHPTVGIHHHNRYDAFCLADDLMEPYRVVVDEAVARRGDASVLDKNAKRELLGALTRRFTLDGESRTLFDVVARTASSLAAVFAGERKTLVLAEISDGA